MQNLFWFIAFLSCIGTVPNTVCQVIPTDTLFVESVREDPPFIEPGMVGSQLLVQRIAVQHDCRNLPHSHDRLLGSPLVLEVATLTTISRIVPAEDLATTQLSRASIGHEHFDRTNRLTILSDSHGSIERSYSARAIRRHFYAISTPLTADDFPDSFSDFNSATEDSSYYDLSILKSVILYEEMSISFRWWKALNLPGGDAIWGSSSDEETTRNAIIARSTTASFLPRPGTYRDPQTSPWELDLPVDIAKPLYIASRSPQELDRFLGDTMWVSRDGYMTISDDFTTASSTSQSGWILYIPYAGPLLDSLAIGRIPSLREFGVSGFQAAATVAVSATWNWVMGPVTKGLSDSWVSFLNQIINPRTAAAQLSAAEHRTLLRSSLLMDGLMSSSQEAHHIVALEDPRFAAARQQLNRLGIGIDDAINGVGLDPTYHARLHTNQYAIEVTTRILNADTKAQGEQVLSSIAQDLISHDFSY
jgi:hypothetical protein